MKKKKRQHRGPRTRRLNRQARLASAQSWMETQKGRTGRQIARSYRKRYGLDYPCAILELEMLGVTFDGEWIQQLMNTLENERIARARRKAEKAEREEWDSESDDTFAYIAGYTPGGVPYGLTCEEAEEFEREAHESSGIPDEAVDQDRFPF